MRQKTHRNPANPATPNPGADERRDIGSVPSSGPLLLGWAWPSNTEWVVANRRGNSQYSKRSPNVICALGEFAAELHLASGDLAPGPGAMMTFSVKKLTFSKKQLLPVFLSAKGENLDYLVKLVKEGKLKTVIDSKHSLSKAEDAWAKSIDGHATEKIIVEP
nr:putative quinone-oxidoreductase like, chloroplastic [Quercus suber]